MTDEIWTYPKGGAVPDLADLLQARTLQDLFETSGARQAAVLQVHEANRDAAYAEARATAADLAAKGVHFDVERILRPTLADRLQEKWYDLLDWWQDRRAPTEPAAPEDAPFAYEITLAITNEPGWIAREYDDLHADVDRMVEGLTRQITAQRGREPVRLSVPEAVMDALEDDDEWSEAAQMAFEACNIVAYWPPNRQPALMLSVVQEDTDHRIEVKLLAHGAPAHRRLMAWLEERGGTAS